MSCTVVPNRLLLSTTHQPMHSLHPSCLAHQRTRHLDQRLLRVYRRCCNPRYAVALQLWTNYVFERRLTLSRDSHAVDRTRMSHRSCGSGQICSALTDERLGLLRNKNGPSSTKSFRKSGLTDLPLFAAVHGLVSCR